MEIGKSHTSYLTVDETNTAIAIGSGDMPVLATPAMMALMENAAMLAVKDCMPEGRTTVGGHIESSPWSSSLIRLRYGLRHPGNPVCRQLSCRGGLR